MRHASNHKKLNRTSAHRKALLSNLAVALITHEQIKTTVPKAKNDVNSPKLIHRFLWVSGYCYLCPKSIHLSQR